MKKRLLALFALSLVLMTTLTSCTVNWFDRQYDVPWWVIAIPVALWSLAWLIGGGLYIASKTYVCPACTRTFSPKWYIAMFSLHINDDRYFKCPHCGKKSFCPLARDRK